MSNDGKIPGFCKFLFLSSVIKFDNEMSEVNKDHNRPTLVYAKSKFTLQDAYDVIYHQVDSIQFNLKRFLSFFDCFMPAGVVWIWPRGRVLFWLAGRLLSLLAR